MEMRSLPWELRLLSLNEAEGNLRGVTYRKFNFNMDFLTPKSPHKNFEDIKKIDDFEDFLKKR